MNGLEGDAVVPSGQTDKAGDKRHADGHGARGGCLRAAVQFGVVLVAAFVLIVVFDAPTAKLVVVVIAFVLLIIIGRTNEAGRFLEIVRHQRSTGDSFAISAWITVAVGLATAVGGATYATCRAPKSAAVSSTTRSRGDTTLREARALSDDPITTVHPATKSNTPAASGSADGTADFDVRPGARLPDGKMPPGRAHAKWVAVPVPGRPKAYSGFRASASVHDRTDVKWISLNIGPGMSHSCPAETTCTRYFEHAFEGRIQGSVTVLHTSVRFQDGRDIFSLVYLSYGDEPAKAANQPYQIEAGNAINWLDCTPLRLGSGGNWYFGETSRVTCTPAGQVTMQRWPTASPRSVCRPGDDLSTAEYVLCDGEMEGQPLVRHLASHGALNAEGVACRPWKLGSHEWAACFGASHP